MQLETTTSVVSVLIITAKRVHSSMMRDELFYCNLVIAISLTARQIVNVLIYIFEFSKLTYFIIIMQNMNQCYEVKNEKYARYLQFKKYLCLCTLQQTFHNSFSDPYWWFIHSEFVWSWELLLKSTRTRQVGHLIAMVNILQLISHI